MSVFAPDCADILDKYEHSIRFVYSKEDCPSVEEAKTFDEIWIFENVLTFSTRRLLRNWENELGNKIRVFHSANEMVVYTKNIININGEK